jgi:hypothetical protein
VSVGRLFAGPGLVVQGRYAFAFSEGAVGYPRRFSTMSAETAYFWTPALRLLAMTSARIGHTGINLTPTTGVTLPPEIFRHHDQISRESYFNLGGGAAFSLNDSFDVFGSFTTTLAGRNTHAVNRGLSLGVTWTFSRRGDDFITARNGREGALAKCICQKAGD